MTREAVSKHLRVLVTAGVVEVQPRGRERLYTLRPDALREVDQWLEPYRAFWHQRLDALETEIARGRLARRQATTTAAASATQPHTTSSPGA